jgi:ribosome-binding factor A
MSHHLEKVQATLARAVQQVISQGLHDPRAGGLISVTKIDLSPDMASAMVFVSIYPEDRQELSMHALRHAARHIRHQAAELIALRRMPELQFRLDVSLKHQARVYQALAQASSPLPAAPESPEEAAPVSPGWGRPKAPAASAFDALEPAKARKNPGNPGPPKKAKAANTSPKRRRRLREDRR